MENAEIKRKKAKIKELHDIENNINKQITAIDKKIMSCNTKHSLYNAQKNKLAKRISHNMKLRNKIISELN